MAADSSFDVTSKIDRMELDNAINQAVREIETRFDFKNTCLLYTSPSPRD